MTGTAIIPLVLPECTIDKNTYNISIPEAAAICQSIVLRRVMTMYSNANDANKYTSG
jgi:hypothetical protein